MPQGHIVDDGSRETMRSTFDSVADAYDQARPEYPPAIFDAVVDLADIRRGDLLLEVGCGTGKATRVLAERGFAVTCVELGRELAATAQRNLASEAGVTVRHGSFEDWPVAGAHAPFALVFAATAWHWIDPEIAYRRAWELLRPGGHLAFWSATHVLPDDGDRFFTEIQDVYDEIGASPPGAWAWHRPGELPDQQPAIQASGLFDAIEVRHFDWEVVYDADGYIALLNTFSDHIAMHPRQRERLYGEIRRRLAKRSDGQLRRHWGAVLHVARRSNA